MGGGFGRRDWLRVVLHDDKGGVMHRSVWLLAAIVAVTSVCLAAAALAGAATFSNPAAITINDGGSCAPGPGFESLAPAPATPYPSVITVSGLSNTVTDVNVTLTGLTHTFAKDVDVLVVGPGGEMTILMADSGGAGSVSGVNLTFDDAAAAPIPDNSAPASGSYQPAVGTTGGGDGCRSPASFPAPAPAGPYGAPSLSVFNGTDPNGTWSLYVIDDTGGDTGSISGGWSLDITAEETPEEKITDLRELIAGLDIHHGTANALDSKLEEALDALEADDKAGACDSLQAFLNQVSAQSGKKLTEDQAEELMDAANEIRTLLDC
jgi:subtilisin-like proprotein convertase family protein